MKIDNGLNTLLTNGVQTQKVDNNVQGSKSSAFADVLASASVTKTATSANVATAAPQASDYRSVLVSSAKQDDAHAEKLLGDVTSGSYYQLINVSEWPTIRYSVSGELQTPESKAYFESTSASALIDRTELLNAERAKGTSAAEILDKVLAFNTSLPSRFKDMAGITS
ncbi:hypothetical protein [Pseudomonas syringae group sp. J309-1]|uniref:hypothetical protein n=1 Tax=Pseudomonas syringae group sp. J309-1 TaxID=3079588 RepID=UPI00290A9D3E|nr:hypothetical protein [Pseudomonas syringae group sp. J309-1]MDU8360100.1 hypothetical protein [Pseudomonas syringae group sp. J309-1]